LPRGEVWYHIFTSKKYDGTGEHQEVKISLNNFGLFIRAGTIIAIHKVDE